MRRKVLRERIPGVSGFPHFHWLEKRIGMAAFNQGQLVDGTNTTPWIEQKVSCVNAFANEKFAIAHENLKPVYNDIYTMGQELHLLSLPAPAPAPAEGEEGLRLAAEWEARRLAAAVRKEAIFLRLAQCREEMDAVDAALWYRLDRASSILRSHIASYWKGILSASQNCELPPFPALEVRRTAGQETYEQSREAAEDLLDRLLRDNKEGEMPV